MLSFLNLLDTVLSLYVWVLIVSAILSWLVLFNAVNPHNHVVSVIMDVCGRLTEPVLRQIRRVVPVMNGIDLSPMVLILGIFFARSLLREYGPMAVGL